MAFKYIIKQEIYFHTAKSCPEGVYLNYETEKLMVRNASLGPRQYLEGSWSYTIITLSY